MQDKGIMVRLPPWTPDETVTDMASRNVFKILINADDKILAREIEIPITKLKEEIKTFISNPNQEKNLASDPKKAVVSLQNDRSTSYKSYLSVYNEIKSAYNELRNEQAQLRHQRSFNACSTFQQREIRKDIPLVISEAEPTDYKED